MAAMATVAQVATALKSKLDAISGVAAFDYAPGSIPGPSAVVIPGPPIEITVNRHLLTREYRVLLLVPQTAEASAQYKLFGYLDVFGTSSVRAVVEADKTLGLTGVTATYMGDDGLSQIDWAGVSYFGSTITVRVATIGDS